MKKLAIIILVLITIKLTASAVKHYQINKIEKVQKTKNFTNCCWDDDENPWGDELPDGI